MRGYKQKDPESMLKILCSWLWSRGLEGGRQPPAAAQDMEQSGSPRALLQRKQSPADTWSSAQGNSFLTLTSRILRLVTSAVSAVFVIIYYSSNQN